MTSQELYRDVILDHARHPRNRGTIQNPDFETKVHNPLCGDELVLYLQIQKDFIEDCQTMVRGCSICQASASMMSEEVQGKSMDDVSKLSRDFQNNLMVQDSVLNKNMENLVPLMNLKSHKSRIKCVALAWNALDECLEKYHKRKTLHQTK